MKIFISILFIFLIFSSCTHFEEKKEYKYLGWHNLKSKTFYLDSFPDYNVFIDSLDHCLCRDVRPIFVLENDSVRRIFYPMNMYCSKKSMPIIDYDSSQLIDIFQDSIYIPILDKSYPFDSLSFSLNRLYQPNISFKQIGRDYKFIFFSIDSLTKMDMVKFRLEKIFIEFEKHKAKADTLECIINFRKTPFVEKIKVVE